MKKLLGLKAFMLSLCFVTAMMLPGNVKGQTYKKVTTALSNWNGTYLIVYESGEKIATGEKSDAGQYLASIDVTIDDHTITGNMTDYEVVIDGNKIKRGDVYLYHGTNQTCWFNNTSSYTYWYFGPNGIYDKSSLLTPKIRYYGTRNDFRYITSGTAAVLYRRQPEEKAILGAGTEDNNRYYLIASPVTTLTPSTDNGFLREDGDVDYYDLYSFDQSNNDEWRNYKESNFNLVSGKGYLYANKDDVTLVFDGAFHNHKEHVVSLAYTDGQKLAGWNLIGNPFDVTAYLTDCRDFLRMNDDGSGFIVASGGIEAMEGVFVQATGTGQSVTFTVTDPSSKDAVNSRVVMNIIGSNDNVIDRAIVRFGEGSTLSKLMLNENNTKIYFPRGDGDYAVVRSNGQNNIPVNFKASKMGQYTISIEMENVSADYFHLIDKINGEDINLLVENKYSFIASPVDDEDRFVLKFNESDNPQDVESPVFAYQKGSDIIVRGEGKLQIWDVTGRLIATRCVSGVETVRKPSQTGVYIFKLNEKVQKIVVK